MFRVAGERPTLVMLFWHRSRRHESIALCERSVTSILRRQQGKLVSSDSSICAQGEELATAPPSQVPSDQFIIMGRSVVEEENVIPLLNAFAYKEWSFEVFDSGRDTEASIPSWYFIMLATTQTRRMTRPPHSPCCHSSQHALADV